MPQKGYASLTVKDEVIRQLASYAAKERERGNADITQSEIVTKIVGRLEPTISFETILGSLSQTRIIRVIDEELFRVSFQNALDRLLGFIDYAKYGDRQLEELLRQTKKMTTSSETVTYVRSLEGLLALMNAINIGLSLQLLLEPMFAHSFPSSHKALTKKYEEERSTTENLLIQLKNRLKGQSDESEEVLFTTTDLVEKAQSFLTAFQQMLDLFKENLSIQRLGQATKTLFGDLSKAIDSYKASGIREVQASSRHGGEYEVRFDKFVSEKSDKENPT